MATRARASSTKGESTLDRVTGSNAAVHKMLQYREPSRLSQLLFKVRRLGVVLGQLRGGQLWRLCTDEAFALLLQ